MGLLAAKKAGAYPSDYIYLHCKVDEVLKDEQILQFDEVKVTVLLLPGHSIESACYLVEKNKKKYLFSGDSIYLNGTLSVINCYGSSLDGYRNNIGKFAGRDVDALIPSHSRLVMSEGQKHIDKAIEFLSYSSLPPMI